MVFYVHGADAEVGYYGIGYFAAERYLSDADALICGDDERSRILVVNEHATAIAGSDVVPGRAAEADVTAVILDHRRSSLQFFLCRGGGLTASAKSYSDPDSR